MKNEIVVLFKDRIAEILEAHRKRLGLSRNDFANLMHKHPNTVQKIFTGVARKQGDPIKKQMVNLLDLIIISKIVGCTAPELLAEILEGQTELENSLDALNYLKKKSN
jgi:hypothetical protein